MHARLKCILAVALLSLLSLTAAAARPVFESLAASHPFRQLQQQTDGNCTRPQHASASKLPYCFQPDTGEAPRMAFCLRLKVLAASTPVTFVEACHATPGSHSS